MSSKVKKMNVFDDKWIKNSLIDISKCFIQWENVSIINVQKDLFLK